MAWRDPKPAPAGLELVRAFVNTRDIARGGDRLTVPAEATEWFTEVGLMEQPSGKPDSVKMGLARPTPAISASGLRRATELREALRLMLLAHNNGNADTSGPQLVVNMALLRGRVVPSLDASGELHLNVRASGLGGALGEIAAIVAEATADGSWLRLKACPSCDWAFYDATRNGAGRWCDMKVCGNRAKQQAFHARHPT
jgi:predicted RNA-binding Zn ribbon-like protein